jgi:ABC-2 type transport system permease protein
VTADRGAAPVGRTAAGPSPAAPAWRATLALVRLELRLALRRGESLLVTAILPPVVLVFFSAVPLAGPGGEAAVEALLPGTLTLAVFATGLVSLGIATAYERSYGVLKRLGGSPLPRTGVVAAKLATVGLVEAVQVGLLLGIAGAALGWRPDPGWSPALAVLVLLLGTAAAAGLGLAIAGTLRAEAALAVANGLFLGVLLLGGVVVPLERLPEAVEAIARVLPPAAMTEALRAALGAPVDATGPVLVLAGWAVGAVVVAATRFRWA